YDGIGVRTGRVQLLDDTFRKLLLLIIVVKDNGSVLGTYIRTLTIACCGVVATEERLQQRSIADFFRIVENLYYFRMTGAPCTNHFIGRVSDIPSRIS